MKIPIFMIPLAEAKRNLRIECRRLKKAIAEARDVTSSAYMEHVKKDYNTRSLEDAVCDMDSSWRSMNACVKVYYETMQKLEICIPDELNRTLLLRRYIDRKSWDDIASELEISRETILERMKSIFVKQTAL